MKRITLSLAALACAAYSYFAGSALAAIQTNIPGPTGSDEFGAIVRVLPNGNIVVADPYYDVPQAASDVGAVYLYNSAGALISKLTGSSPNDRVGVTGVTVLANGNFVVRSSRWSNGTAAEAGAATWCSGTSGCSGEVSPANSLVGITAGDQVGNRVSVLPNGHYVVRSPLWDNGAVADAGAVTWCNGSAGRTGEVSAANSLVGSTADDEIGSNGVAVLPNGHYVVSSPEWNNGAIVDAGAATWCDGTTGCVGAVTTANSLYGTTATDRVASAQTLVLPNGNYVVGSRYWSNGAALDTGAATWGDGTTGRVGAVSPANSLVGTKTEDFVGTEFVALTNGNYVVLSADWDNGAVASAGAVTWCVGTSGCIGEVSPSNSLVGSRSQDRVGGNSVLPLTNGNYVVSSPSWDAGGTPDVGAVTWCNGTTGLTGQVSTGNSLIGISPGDLVGIGLLALTNGNYVVQSTEWNNGPLADVGAATWCNGTQGCLGLVSTGNSLVGTQFADRVGSSAIALTNGHYVVGSGLWDNGAIEDTGAATWCDGMTGCKGAISASNSLVGAAGDQVGRHGLTALANGNYLVNSNFWGGSDVGAITWCSGDGGCAGTVSASNSLIGSTAADQVGSAFALPDGNYVVHSRAWDNGAVLNAGAMTLGRGDIGTAGVIDATNSVRGATPNGGELLTRAYNATTGQLVVGLPAENTVSLFASRGPDFVVTTTSDHNDGSCTANDCTLREALTAANAVADDNTITFAPGVAGVIQLTAELPILTGNVTLEGPGADVLTVRRNSGGEYRIFTISNGTPNGPIVTIARLTITNGQAPSSLAFPWQSGGGILNDQGRLIVRNCTIIDNRTVASGARGGGIFNQAGSLTIEESTIAGNMATDGGGVSSLRTTAGNASLTVRNSTFSGNTASNGSGGGINNEATGSGSIADLSLTNCTLSVNSATSSGFFGGAGGAIHNFGANSGIARTSLEDCTISGNNAPSAGGIYNRSFSAAAPLTLRNTILKTGTTGSNFINADGTVTSLGRNLSSDAASGPAGTGPGGYLTHGTDIRNTDPLLGPLEDNGGSSFTHALLNGSPAINIGINATANLADQRGYLRVSTNDIGAYEAGAVPPPVALTSVVSRKTHGSAGTFDVNLPLGGGLAIESRTGGGAANHQLVFTFTNALASVGGVSIEGVGSVASSGGTGDPRQFAVDLTGVGNAQIITVTLTNVTDSLGQFSPSVSVILGLLAGDSNADYTVNSGDAQQTRNRSGQATSPNNFRSDANADGQINSGDATVVRSRSGTFLES